MMAGKYIRIIGQIEKLNESSSIERKIVETEILIRGIFCHWLPVKHPRNE